MKPAPPVTNTRAVFVMPFHNNLRDFTCQLAQTQESIFLSPRPISGSKYLPPCVPIKTLKVWKLKNFNYPAVFSPFSLWKEIQPSDTVYTKHLHTTRNLIVWGVAMLKGAKNIIIIQKHSPWREELAKLFGLKLIPQPTSIDTSRFPKKEPRTAGRIMHILCVAKPQPRKNIKHLISALNHLIRQHPQLDFHLTVAGTGGSPAHEKHLKRHIYKLHVTNYITWLKDIPALDMPQLYSQADIFILPSSHEPFGYAVIEAMAAELPIICSSQVGALKHLPPNQIITIPPRSSRAIASAIGQFISQKSINWHKLHHYGKHNHQVAQTISS